VQSALNVYCVENKSVFKERMKLSVLIIYYVESRGTNVTNNEH